MYKLTHFLKSFPSFVQLFWVPSWIQRFSLSLPVVAGMTYGVRLYNSLFSEYTRPLDVLHVNIYERSAKEKDQSGTGHLRQ
jgi:hypothetical protein